jgi:hypothetical protein
MFSGSISKRVDSGLFTDQDAALKKQQDSDLNASMLKSIFFRKTSFKIDGTSLDQGQEQPTKNEMLYSIIPEMETG